MRASSLILGSILCWGAISNAVAEQPPSRFNSRNPDFKPRNSSAVSQKPASDVSVQCLLTLRGLGSDQFDGLDAGQQLVRNRAITDLQLQYKVTKNELADLALRRLSGGQALVVDKDPETLQLLGHLAMDPAVGADQWRRIVLKLISVFSEARYKTDARSREIAAQALSAIAVTRGKQELRFLQDYLYDHWDVLIDSLNINEARALIPGLAFAVSKAGLGREKVQEILHRLHLYRQNFVTSQWVRLEVAKSDTSKVEELGRSVDAAIDVITTELAMKPLNPRAITFELVTRPEKAQTEKFYLEYQEAIAKSREMDSREPVTRQAFEGENEAELEKALETIELKIKDAKEAYLVMSYASNYEQRFAAAKFAVSRYEILAKLADQLAEYEDYFANLKTSVIVDSKIDGKTATQSGSKIPATLTSAKEDLERALRYDLGELVVYSKLKHRADLDALHNFMARFTAVYQLKKAGREVSEIPLDQLKLWGESDGEAFKALTIQFTPPLSELDFIGRPRVLEPLSYVVAMGNNSGTSESRDAAERELKIYLDDLQSSVDGLMTRLATDAEPAHLRAKPLGTHLGYIPHTMDREELEKKFRYSRRLINYASNLDMLAQKMPVALSGVQTNFFYRDEIKGRFQRFSNRLKEINRTFAEARLFDYATTLQIYQIRDAIVRKYYPQLYSENGEFLLSNEEAERIGRISDDARFEAALVASLKAAAK